jgi:hypothetical protein
MDTTTLSGAVTNRTAPFDYPISQCPSLKLLVAVMYYSLGDMKMYYYVCAFMRDERSSACLTPFKY